MKGGKQPANQHGDSCKRRNMNDRCMSARPLRRRASLLIIDYSLLYDDWLACGVRSTAQSKTLRLAATMYRAHARRPDRLRSSARCGTRFVDCDLPQPANPTAIRFSD